MAGAVVTTVVGGVAAGVEGETVTTGFVMVQADRLKASKKLQTTEKAFLITVPPFCDYSTHTNH